MQWLKNKKMLQGFLIATLLTACAAASVVGAGCEAYFEQRLSLPFDELVESPREVILWIDFLDVRMNEVCK